MSLKDPSPASYFALLATLAVACVPPGADDPFHARVAAGCDSVAACKSLYSEASASWTECHNANIGDYGVKCASLRQDRDAAERMLDDRLATAQQADRVTRTAKTRRESDLLQKYQNDERALGDSCEDIASLEATAATIRQQDPTEGMVSRYTVLAQSRRAERVRSLNYQLQMAISSRASLSEAQDPSDALEAIPKARALLDRLQCYDADAAATVRSNFDGWASGVEKAVADERRCRATPACMGARVAAPLCDAVQARRDAVQRIAHERANPAGVVDLTTLHDLGQAVQDNDATIAELKAKYFATTHRAFNEATCTR